MRVFLAGCEGFVFTNIAKTAGIKNILFSYYHRASGDAFKKNNSLLNSFANEVICDSGLFTLMFGAGKGGSYDFNYMRDYTKKYLHDVSSFGINNLTIVESDVHKLLGMAAVFELRKYFEDSGYPVLYVWHKEEGIDGLLKMSEKYKYIALSIPELRVLCKDKKTRYQDVTKNLLNQIRRHNGIKTPKIHLLGNTVQETMETSIAYSCDSTSWLSGGRFGRAIAYKNNKLINVSIRSQFYKTWFDEVFSQNKKHFKEIEDNTNTQKSMSYSASMLFSACAMQSYQDFLNKYFIWSGEKNEDQS